VQAEQRRDIINFVSLETGLFALKRVDASPIFDSVLKSHEGKLPPIDFFYRPRSDKELANAWRTGSLSITDLLLRANMLRGRSFVDLEQYPVFPDFPCDVITEPLSKTEVIGRLASICPFNFFSCGRTIADTRGVIPEDFYFHAIDDGADAAEPVLRRQALEGGTYLPTIGRMFGLQLSSERPLTPLCADATAYASRRIATRVQRGDILIFDDGEVMSLPGLQRRLIGIADVAVAFDTSVVAIAIRNYKKIETLYTLADLLLGFTTHLSVGEFELYFVMDLSVGLSLGFHVEYGARGSASFHNISRFEGDAAPFSLISDRAAVCATFSGRTVTIWHIWSGVVHRSLKFELKVTMIAIDAEFEGLIVANFTRVCYVNFNGDILCEVSLTESDRITAMKCMEMPIAESRRGVFCGTITGEIWILLTDFRTKTFEIVKLESGHK
jgi:hypothetical protein